MMKQLYTLLFFLIPFGSIVAAPTEVRTGMYLLNLYDLNMDEHSFYADFYVWFKWKGEIDPTNFELVNAVEKWGLTTSAFDEDSVQTLQDGTHYRIMRIEGRFFHSYKLEHFPLDEHELDIQLENPDFPTDQLIYLPDTGASADIRPSLHIDGWRIHSPKLVQKEHDYRSNFGNHEENARSFSNLTYTISLKRPLSYFFLKMMLPLFVVMLVSIGALLLHPSYIDTRSQLPIGGLLTAVFLQQSYNSALPDTGYMVLMDKIYLLAYAIISGVLLQVIMAGNAIIKGNDSTVHKIDWQEAWQSILLFTAFAIGVVVLCYSSI